MKETIKINFADFWNHFDKTDNYFTRLLSGYFKIELSNDPEFLIYSCYGYDHLNYNCYKIFYNGENLRVNWNACDFAFSFDYMHDKRHYRLPNWIWYANTERLAQPKPDAASILASKKGFCNMVISNSLAKKRIEFFHKLSKYKKVDSGGRYLNNVGGPVADKLSFVKDYKFTIAFENSSYPGYTTEKLFEPMLVNSIPVYWGNPLVEKDFNTKSFINYHEYGNDEAVIERIIELDKSDDLYVSMQQQPWYNGNQTPDCVVDENVLARFVQIFREARQKKPVSQTNQRFLYKAFLQWKRADGFFNQYLKYRENFR